jgi:peroxiredoxin
MVQIATPTGAVRTVAPDFLLADAVSGETISLADVRGTEATLVMFICNHCPYVQAVIDRVVRDCRELEPLGVRAVAIMPNDVAAYPDDAPELMKRFAQQHKFPFPYLHDESQTIARAYGAVCTPDFFGFDQGLRLAYRGRVDAAGLKAPETGIRRELFEAMAAIARGKGAPSEQFPSIGCSIKWRGAH